MKSIFRNDSERTMLSSLLTHEDINLVEIYWVRRKVEYGYEMNGNVKCLRALQDAYGSGTKQKLFEYVHGDMVYVYDRADDRQRLSRKIVMKEWEIMPFYGVGYKEEILPSHMFPCLDNLTHKQEIDRTTIRVNNRIFITMDVTNSQTMFYIRYQHANNVDVRKMEMDMDRIMNIMKRVSV